MNDLLTLWAENERLKAENAQLREKVARLEGALRRAYSKANANPWWSAEDDEIVKAALAQSQSGSPVEGRAE